LRFGERLYVLASLKFNLHAVCMVRMKEAPAWRVRNA
jgi:hypothetical protein